MALKRWQEHPYLPPKPEIARGGSSVGLMLANLSPPVIWLTWLQLNYMAVQQACIDGQRWILFLIDAVAVVLIAICALPAWRVFSQVGRGALYEDPLPIPRVRFMAWSGLLITLGFLIVQIAGIIPTLILSPCAGT